MVYFFLALLAIFPAIMALQSLRASANIKRKFYSEGYSKASNPGQKVEITPVEGRRVIDIFYLKKDDQIFYVSVTAKGLINLSELNHSKPIKIDNQID